MKIALVTTETPHHLFYAVRVATAYPLSLIVIEQRVPRYPFETAHPYERDRDEYERATLLGGCTRSFDVIAPTLYVSTANDAPSVLQLRQLAADVVLSFGPGRLTAPARSARVAALNVHGGDPERYRGLDSHLWAVYHADWQSLTTTIHHLAGKLDTGGIARRAPVPVVRDLSLHQLRAANTRLAVDLTLDALAEARVTGGVACTPQTSVGRYYSAMPSVLKDVCVSRFRAHTARL